MSATRSVVRGRIQELIGDVNPAERVVGQFRYDEVIGRNMHLLGARCAMGRDSVVSVTLVAGTYDYAVHATLQYRDVSQVFLNDDGAELGFVPREQFDAYYLQDTADPVSSGTPREYTVYENTSSLTRIRVGPTPDAAGTLKVHASSIPALLTSDGATIPFSLELLRALESQCAAEIVLMLGQDALAKLGLDRAVAQKWTAEVDRTVRAYNQRVHDLGTRQNRILRYGGRRVKVNA